MKVSVVGANGRVGSSLVENAHIDLLASPDHWLINNTRLDYTVLQPRRFKRGTWIWKNRCQY